MLDWLGRRAAEQQHLYEEWRLDSEGLEAWIYGGQEQVSQLWRRRAGEALWKACTGGWLGLVALLFRYLDSDFYF